MFTPAWSHGKYLDYWSFVHLLTGVILGIMASLRFDEPVRSFLVILSLLAAYEGIEMMLHIAEGWQNIALDIVIGAGGAGISLFALPQIVPRENILGILSFFIIVTLMLLSRGWENFLKRKAWDAGSYKPVLYLLNFIFILGILAAVLSLLYWWK